MHPITVLVVDDEVLARLRLRKLLAREPSVKLLGECASGEEAVDFIRTHKPQLVFLDIEMNQLDGFDVIEQLATEEPPVFVFVTAYDQYAVRAFDAHALDYLLKPFTDERFYRALAYAQNRIRKQQLVAYSERLMNLIEAYKQAVHLNPNPLAEARPERLVLKTGGRMIFLRPDEIDWIEAEGVYVRLHVGAKSHLVRESLSSMEHRLDPSQFIRIHRSTIVNADRVRDIVPHFNGGAVVMLHDGKQLKLSRGYRDKVRAVLG